MQIELTAQKAYELYHDALTNDWLAQGAWNSEQNGKRIACALGVLDPSVDSPADCPATVMPRWLARMVPWLFDGQTREDAFAWGELFYAQLSRLNGAVPFEVVYDWHANYSWQMGIEAAEKRGRDPSAMKVIQDLHRRAMTGDRAPRDEWYAALRNAYANAYANADADADADANANAYANARQKAINRLAIGLVECMARVPSPVTEIAA